MCQPSLVQQTMRFFQTSEYCHSVVIVPTEMKTYQPWQKHRTSNMPYDPCSMLLGVLKNSQKKMKIKYYKRKKEPAEAIKGRTFKVQLKQTDSQV